MFYFPKLEAGTPTLSIDGGEVAELAGCASTSGVAGGKREPYDYGDVGWNFT